MIIPVLEGLTLSKGHAGGHDAIIFPDLTASREVTVKDATKILDRTTGIGGEVLMRVVRANSDSTLWRVDTWSVDELRDIGPILRLAAHYLHVSGLVALGDGDVLAFETPDGPVYVTRAGNRYLTQVSPSTPVSKEAVERGYDVAVTLDGVTGARGGMRGGLTVMSNDPSIVVALEHSEELHAATGSGKVDPEKPGAGLVLVVPLGDAPFLDFDGVERDATRFQVRGFRDGREKLTDLGIRDAAIALHAWAGEAATGIYQADAGGHEIEVRLSGGSIEVTGPAKIVAEFNLAGIVGEGS